jgi:hypothetical protein
MVAKQAGELVQIEPQPALRAPQAHRSQLAGVRVDPVALDAERPRDLGRVDVANSRRP